jgi:TldD protein
VIEGAVLGAMFGETVGAALELDRALGYESDATGTSYLARPVEVLGKTVINPLLNVTANRAMPHVQAVKWDDDGVEPEEYTVLKDGVVVDYHTSRQTAPALAAWYRAQGKPVRSHGCAAAGDAGEPVTVQTPHLTVAPGRGTGSFEDLYKGMTHGLVVTKPDPFWMPMDHRLSGGELSYIQMFEVVRGKIVGRVKDAGLQFQTLPFWKSLTALGDATTADDTSYELSKGIPWHRALCTASAPAGLFTGVHVVNTGLRF